MYDLAHMLGAGTSALMKMGAILIKSGTLHKASLHFILGALSWHYSKVDPTQVICFALVFHQAVLDRAPPHHLFLNPSNN